MAEDDKTELATGRRLEELSQKGQFAYSHEVAAALSLLIVAMALRYMGSDLMSPLRQIFEHSFTLEGHEAIAIDTIGRFLVGTAFRTAVITVPLLLLALAIVAVSGFLQIGFSFETNRLRMRWERLDFMANFRRIVNIYAFVPLSSSLAKLIAVGWITWGVAEPLVTGASGLSGLPLPDLFSLVGDAALKMAFRVGLFLAVLAGIDFFYQRFRFSKDTMMTKQEVKDENRQAEGDPSVKGKIKARQREISRAKMLREVRKATVVVRNPTHFAVALRYVRGQDPAPRVLAKGQDFLALRIIAEAEKHKVPVVSKPELARELFRVVKVGHTIPEALYKAVAAILAFVLKQKERRA